MTGGRVCAFGVLGESRVVTMERRESEELQKGPSSRRLSDEVGSREVWLRSGMVCSACAVRKL